MIKSITANEALSRPAKRAKLLGSRTTTTTRGGRLGGNLEALKLRTENVDPNRLIVDKVKQHSGYSDDGEKEEIGLRESDAVLRLLGERGNAQKESRSSVETSRSCITKSKLRTQKASGEEEQKAP
jgi:hypothetical protein